MSFFTKHPSRKQTSWGQTASGSEWLAYIDADIDDEEVINQAKVIVDHCSPQQFGPHGTHGYSFLKREYLLNLLLFHYVEHGFFPFGYICITDEWLYKNPINSNNGMWFSFKSRSKGRNYQAGWWIKIPTILEINLAKKSCGSGFSS